MVDAVVRQHGDIDAAVKSIADDELMTSHEIGLCSKLADMLKNEPDSPASISLRSLFKFYEDHDWNPACLSSGDLCAPENWGLAVRQGKICPVILDPGLSR